MLQIMIKCTKNVFKNIQNYKRKIYIAVVKKQPIAIANSVSLRKQNSYMPLQRVQCSLWQVKFVSGLGSFS